MHTQYHIKDTSEIITPALVVFRELVGRLVVFSRFVLGCWCFAAGRPKRNTESGTNRQGGRDPEAKAKL